MTTCHARGMAVTLIVGPEDFLAERAVAAALAGAERAEVDGADERAAVLLRDAMSPTLFGDAPTVVVRNLDQLDDDAAAVVKASVAEGADLILIHPGGVKGKALLTAVRAAGATEVACTAPKRGPETADFIAREFARHRRAVTGDATTALAEAIGTDLRMLSSAISQMCADLDADPIGAAEVHTFFGGVAEVTSFQISDAVWDRRATDALRDLRWALNSGERGRTGPALISSLAGGVRSLARLSGAPRTLSEGQLAAEIGAPPWKIKVLRRQLNRWTGASLAAATLRLAAADAAAKGGVLEGESLDPVQKDAMLESLIVSLATQGAPARTAGTSDS